ncbi:MAG: hypothetical protein JO304_23600 [Solirubrobacterales bacterium]|nr:hypothetical protein [Solirubrobacterales bacterium]
MGAAPVSVGPLRPLLGVLATLSALPLVVSAPPTPPPAGGVLSDPPYVALAGLGAAVVLPVPPPVGTAPAEARFVVAVVVRVTTAAAARGCGVPAGLVLLAGLATVNFDFDSGTARCVAARARTGDFLALGALAR